MTSGHVIIFYFSISVMIAALVSVAMAKDTLDTSKQLTVRDFSIAIFVVFPVAAIGWPIGILVLALDRIENVWHKPIFKIKTEGPTSHGEKT